MCLSLWIQLLYKIWTECLEQANILWLWKKMIAGRLEDKTIIWNTIQYVVIYYLPPLQNFLPLPLIAQPTNTLITVITEIAKRAHRSQSSESAGPSSLIIIVVIPLRWENMCFFFLISLSCLLSYGPRCGHSHRSGQPSGLNKTARGLKKAAQVTRKNWLFEECTSPSFK